MKKLVSKTTVRTYTQYSKTACALLGGMIRAARKEHRWTIQEVAERAGISRGMLQRIGNGNLKCEIGMVFEIAAVVGIKLFNSEGRTLADQLQHTKEKLALLPKSVRKKPKTVRDDF